MSERVLIALIGVGGAVIGSLATISAQWLKHWLEAKAEAKREQPRRDMLLELLEHPQYKWRALETLQHIIGADEETTKRLLVEIGARASEDGKPLWGLLSRNPLPTERQ